MKAKERMKGMSDEVMDLLDRDDESRKEKLVNFFEEILENATFDSKIWTDEQATQTRFLLDYKYRSIEICVLRGKRIEFRPIGRKTSTSLIWEIKRRVVPEIRVELDGRDYDPVKKEVAFSPYSVSDHINIDFLKDDIISAAEQAKEKILDNVRDMEYMETKIETPKTDFDGLEEGINEICVWFSSQYEPPENEINIEEREDLFKQAVKIIGLIEETEEIDRTIDKAIDEIKTDYPQLYENEKIEERKEELREKLIDRYNEERDRVILSKLRKRIEEKDRERVKKFAETLITVEEREANYDETDDICLKPQIDEEKDKVKIIALDKGELGLETRESHPSPYSEGRGELKPYAFIKNAHDYLKDEDLIIEQAYFESKSVLIQVGFRQYFFSETKKELDRTFLVRKVNGKATCTQVPNTIDTVEKAIEYTKPSEVKEAEKDSRDIIEYGDYWFIKMKNRTIKPNDINGNEDEYEYKENDQVVHIEHPYHGPIELPDKKYKPVKKKSAQRKENIKIEKREFDKEKYKEQYNDISEEKKEIIKERAEELIRYNPPDARRDQLLEPTVSNSGEHVVFKEPNNYSTASITELQWLDKIDADEEHLLVVAGHKSYYVGSIWGSQTRKFLLGKEDGTAWFHQVPTTIDTVEDALDYMKPTEIERAEENGRQIERQGDMFFKEMIRKSNMDALEDTRHDAKRTDEGWIIEHPEHKDLELKGKWKAIQNNSASKPGLRGRRLAD